MTELRLRPAQQEILNYTGGYMGVSAVPGSGKTFTLSALTAELIRSGKLGDDQQVLIVTLVNSAVDNFRSRVRSLLEHDDMLPHLGYQVTTLHSLANRIVRDRPDLCGLAGDFRIMDERETNALLRASVETWLGSNPYFSADYLNPELTDRQAHSVRTRDWPDAMLNIARNSIKLAKDRELDANALADLLATREEHPLPLIDMVSGVYGTYQRDLQYNNALDFDDLIRYGLMALNADKSYLQRLQHQWPYILEDEAQDSSQLQQDILRTLAGPGGNWVRVGDPNQAIYETFTTANPKHLRDFINDPINIDVPMPTSGRSGLPIIKTANRLIDWVKYDHLNPSLRHALDIPHIEPTAANDPQPNPPAEECLVHFMTSGFTAQKEITKVVDSVRRWLPDHPHETVAILVPRNQRGYEAVTILKNTDTPYVEFLQSSSATRRTSGALAHCLKFINAPDEPKYLATLWNVWHRDQGTDEDAKAMISAGNTLLKKCRFVEDFLWPASSDWLDQLEPIEENEPLRERLLDFRVVARRWLNAATLPIDQLAITIGQELFITPAELALTHKLAVELARRGATGTQDLSEHIEFLGEIAKNERKFFGATEEDAGFDPEQHKGKVVVTTMHKGKGLEWDRVYLLAANSYGFPSALPGDQFIPEKWFVRDKLNLDAEAQDQLMALLHNEDYEEGIATQAARIEYSAERLRLLFVGITRARKELIVTWNTGRKGDLGPAAAFTALADFVEAEKE